MGIMREESEKHFFSVSNATNKRARTGCVQTDQNRKIKSKLNVIVNKIKKDVHFSLIFCQEQIEAIKMVWITFL